MTDQPARLTLLGKLISIALIVGLIGFGSYLVMKRSPGGKIFQGGGSEEVSGNGSSGYFRCHYR